MSAKSLRFPALASLVPALLLGATARPAAAVGWDLTGRRAPDLHIDSGFNGVSAGQNLSSFRGEVLVVKFFFTRCPACQSSMPEFESLHRQYAGKPVRFLGLAEDSYSNVASFIASQGLTFPVGVDTSGASASAYGIRSYPTNYVIGVDGVVKAYDYLDRGVIEREVNAAVRTRNVEQLGSVPAAISAARDAAADNDYGQVLRIVEPHLDPAKEPAEVVAAAKRIQAIAKERYKNRVRRVQANADGGWLDLAATQARQVAEDFKGTSLASEAAAFAASLEKRARG